MRLTSREQKFFAAVIILLFVGGGYFLAIRPLQQKIESTDQKIQSQKRRLKKNKQLIANADQTQKQFASYVQKFEQTKSNDMTMSSIVAEIEQVAGNLELRISDLKPKQVKEEEFFNRFSVSLTIDSEFGDVMEFLYILQGQKHFFNIEDLRFDKGSRRKSSTVKSRLVLSKVLIPQQ